MDSSVANHLAQVSYGGYRLGANSANILVQDRLTGMINEERMSVYVRLGIRLLYKGLKSRNMENDKSMLHLKSICPRFILTIDISPQALEIFVLQAGPKVR